jgi:hypothetical protein
VKVCLSTPNTLLYPQGGHLWVFVNWALGLRACGCDVTWLDVAPTSMSPGELLSKYAALRAALQPFGLDQIAVQSWVGDDLPDVHSLENFGPFELLIDFRYDLCPRLLQRFKRTALVNIDPGQYEIALANGSYPQPQHHVLFSIGEHAEDRFVYTPPCVYLDEWPATPGRSTDPWTTIAHWWGTGKHQSFAPFMTLPSRVSARFDLALNLEHPEEQRRIESFGFHVLDAHRTVASPHDYRRFIQGSAGEFSCASPLYVELQDAWISDRTLCYLASGRPCIVQDTGPSRFLPSSEGLHRFRDLDGAVAAIQSVTTNYDAEAMAARALAEEFFDARTVCASLLERALS